MKKATLLSCITLFIYSTAAFSQTSDAYSLKSIAAREARTASAKAEFTSSGITKNYDVNYHRLDLKTDPRIRYIAGSVTTYFTINEASSALAFNLSKKLSSDSVLYHGFKLSFVHDTLGEFINVSLPTLLPVGASDSIAVYYHGIPTLTGFGSFETSDKDNIPVLWTLSEPYGAKDWWPCKQTLDDKVDSVDVHITCPAKYKGVSNGMLKAITHKDSLATYVWKHRYPIANYLIAFAVSDYAIDSIQINTPSRSFPLVSYAFKPDLESAKNLDQELKACLSFFDEAFGPYPFNKEKYGHTQCRFNGGMEHQSNTFLGGFNWDLCAHELAHQWFGDKLTCGSWSDIWLNEGFATYLTGLAKEKVRSQKEWMDWKLVLKNCAGAPAVGSVWVPDTTNYQRIFSSPLSYCKGAAVLNMLRWTIGHTAFFEAMHRYATNPANSYNFVRTSALQKEFEEVSGEDLDWFFQQWVYGEGRPSYEVHWKQENSRLELQVFQKTSHPSVPFYKMPVSIGVKGPLTSKLLRLQHDSSGQKYSIDLNFRVDSVFFDPELWLLSYKDTVIYPPVNNTVESIIKVYPNPCDKNLSLEIVGRKSLLNRISLYASDGKEVFRQYIDPAESDRLKFSIPVLTLPNGFYLLKAVFNNTSQTTPFVISNSK